MFTTFRTHPLVHASYLPACSRPWCWGPAARCPPAALIAYGCLVTLPHANLRWTFGPLGRVLVSPAYHRLHHARARSTPGARQPRLRAGLLGPTGPPGRFPRGGSRWPPGSPDGRCRSSSPAPARASRVVLAQLAQPFRPGRHGRPVMRPRPAGPRVAEQSGPPSEPVCPRRGPAGRPGRLGLDLHLPRSSTLFGAFGGPGIHGQTVFFIDVAHLQPAMFFAVLSGIIEFFGGIAVGLGIFGRIGRRRPGRRHGHRHGHRDLRATASSRPPPGRATSSTWPWPRMALVVAVLGTGPVLARRAPAVPLQAPGRHRERDRSIADVVETGPKTGRSTTPMPVRASTRKACPTRRWSPGWRPATRGPARPSCTATERRVFGIALAITMDRATAEDVAQEAFLRAWRHAAVFDPRRAAATRGCPPSPATWPSTPSGFDGPVPVGPERRRLARGGQRREGPRRPGRAGRRRRSGTGGAAVHPREQRRALVRSAFYGQSASEIAAAEAIPLGTAKSRIRLGLAKVRHRSAGRRSRWTPLRTMRRVPVQDDLAALAIGALNGRDRSVVLGHLEGCARCAAELEELSAAVDALLTLIPEATPPEGFGRAPRPGSAPRAGASAGPSSGGRWPWRRSSSVWPSGLGSTPLPLPPVGPAPPCARRPSTPPPREPRRRARVVGPERMALHDGARRSFVGHGDLCRHPRRRHTSRRGPVLTRRGLRGVGCPPAGSPPRRSAP